MSKDNKDKEMICGLTADERDLLQQELRGLPDMMPPRGVWQRIREQAEAEGLGHTGRNASADDMERRDWTRRCCRAGRTPGAGHDGAARSRPALRNRRYRPANIPSVTALQALMVESRQLETDLRSMPEQPQGAPGRDGGNDFRDRGPHRGHRLTSSMIRRITMTEEDKEIFWRERVRLMKLLVGLRYAQAQRTGY